ncbi:hypothetical protein LJC29_07650 [Bacteroides sp. OttesenSCG-928-N06]|nr:hypothetical protein [Bacteroides sp. OttesenSCG-928-N06]
MQSVTAKSALKGQVNKTINAGHNINLPLQGADGRGDDKPQALPGAEITWACSPKEGQTTIQYINNQ